MNRMHGTGVRWGYEQVNRSGLTCLFLLLLALTACNSGTPGSPDAGTDGGSADDATEALYQQPLAARATQIASPSHVPGSEGSAASDRVHEMVAAPS